MKSIHIRDLEVPGLMLLSDEESYLDEMSDHEIEVTLGGFSTPGCVAVTILATIASVGASIKLSEAARKIHDNNDLWTPIGRL